MEIISQLLEKRIFFLLLWYLQPLFPCKAYKKGDKESIYYIADRYKNAIKNGEWCLKMMEDDVGSMCASDERDKKLFKTEKTFTTVHEAIQYMENTKIS